MRELALIRLRDAVLAERRVYPSGDPVHNALGRAERALMTAAQLASPEPSTE
ncbi:MAG: hypothetical protein V4515_01805 [Chloroflexota bacterium]